MAVLIGMTILGFRQSAVSGSRSAALTILNPGFPPLSERGPLVLWPLRLFRGFSVSSATFWWTAIAPCTVEAQTYTVAGPSNSQLVTDEGTK